MKSIPALLMLAVATGALAQEPPSPPERAPEAAEKPAAGQSVPAAVAARREPGFRTMDRLELETTSITGSQELPKVMYVVPWKKAELGDLAGRPVRSLIDEILAPVDREVFRREVGYFETLDGIARDPSAQGETPVTPETARP